MAKHTPGPWEAVYNEDFGGFSIWMTATRGSYEPQRRAYLGDGMWSHYDDGPLPPAIQKQFDELQANARLIAAAPDLYEAAKAVVIAVDNHHPKFAAGPYTLTADEIAALRAAIAAAEGVE